MMDGPMNGPCNVRYALITGAASGLGRALAVRLARDSWCVGIADVDENESYETLRLVEAAGGAGRVEPLDVTRIDLWQVLVQRLQAAWPRLDMLVNNAGVACSGQVGVTPLENWRWLIETNLFGVIHGCHACLDWLKQNPRRASLVNIASISAVLAAPAMATYNVAKAGVLALSETMACELHATNVKVTVACPGFFRTRLLDGARFQTQFERQWAEFYTDSAPLNCEQIADQIVRAAYCGKLHVFLPARARWAWYLRRIAPSLWIKFVGAGYARDIAKFQAMGQVLQHRPQC
jgi:NAD(P)-dependent dehydrogenase (short-subunit alcohol dehydrogenase family)